MEDFGDLIRVTNDPETGTRGLQHGSLVVTSVRVGGRRVIGGKDDLSTFSFADAMSAYIEDTDSDTLGSLMQAAPEDVKEIAGEAPLTETGEDPESSESESENEKSDSKTKKGTEKVVVLGDLMIRGPPGGALRDEALGSLMKGDLGQAAREEELEDVPDMLADVDIQVSEEAPFVQMGTSTYTTQMVD